MQQPVLLMLVVCRSPSKHSSWAFVRRSTTFIDRMVCIIKCKWCRWKLYCFCSLNAMAALFSILIGWCVFKQLNALVFPAIKLMCCLHWSTNRQTSDFIDLMCLNTNISLDFFYLFLIIMSHALTCLFLFLSADMWVANIKEKLKGKKLYYLEMFKIYIVLNFLQLRPYFIYSQGGKVSQICSIS